MSKKCISCGAALDNSASFCLHCATSQIQKNTIPLPKIWRRKTFTVISTLLFILLLTFVASLIHIPRSYSGEGNLTYTLKGEEYTFVLRKDMDSPSSLPFPVTSSTYFIAQDGSTESSHINLFVYRDGQLLFPSEVLPLIENISFTTVPANGGRSLTIFEAPHSLYTSSFSLIGCTINYSAECFSNTIYFTVKMKNGDTLEITHLFTVLPLAVIRYDHTTAPMNTTEDLQTLFNSFTKETLENSVIILYLPPVSYHGELHLPSGNFRIYGSTDGEDATTFHDTVTVLSDNPHDTQLYDLHFSGSGKTGLCALSHTTLLNCVFSGWDIGAACYNSGWITFNNCTFQNNRTGLLIKAGSAQNVSVNFPDNRFIGNDIALDIQATSFMSPLVFAESTFTDNGTNVKNDIDIPVTMPVF